MKMDILKTNNAIDGITIKMEYHYKANTGQYLDILREIKDIKK